MDDRSSTIRASRAPRLAQQIDAPVNSVTEIINGPRGITTDTAIRLGHWFGTSPEFWLMLSEPIGVEYGTRPACRYRSPS
jgi:addiction module HigA family antidote